jgi:hypothetical protein
VLAALAINLAAGVDGAAHLAPDVAAALVAAGCRGVVAAQRDLVAVVRAWSCCALVLCGV